MYFYIYIQKRDYILVPCLIRSDIKAQTMTDGRSNLGRTMSHENRAKHTKKLLDNFGDKFDVIKNRTTTY
jgi:hypothetical protein